MTLIRVIHNYGGADTHDRRILPGIYEIGDPRLFGVAQILLEDGHAVPFEVGAEAPAPTPSAVESDSFAVVEVPAPAAETESVEGDSDNSAAEDELPTDEEKPSKRKGKHE